MHIPLTAFLMTNRGRLVERRMEMARDKVMSVGVSISALALADPRGEARSGVQQRPAAAAPAAAAGDPAAEGAAEGRRGAEGAEGMQQQEGGDEGEGEGGEGEGVEVVSSEFRLLIREIRAEGRAGDV